MQRLAAALVVGLVAGCGGTASAPSTGGSIPESASFAPRDAADFIALDTDFDGEQWRRLEALAGRFPDAGQVTGAVRSQLGRVGVRRPDVRASVGPDVAIADWSSKFGSDSVVLTRPRDASRLEAVLSSVSAGGGPHTLTRSVEGWMLVSDSRGPLDRAERAHAGSSFADRQVFRRAFGGLPDDALVRFVTGADLLGKGPTAGSLQVRDDGLRLRVTQAGGGTRRGYEPKLATGVPADALAFVSFDHESLQAFSDSPWSAILLAYSGVLARPGAVDALLDPQARAPFISLVSSEAAVYVRRGSPLPEVTVLLTEPDPKAALARLDALAQKEAKRFGSRVERTEVDGVAARRLTVKGVPVYYAALDGRLVVTDSRSGIDGLTSQGPRLADDPRFREATRAVGVPAGVTWLGYADVHELAPLVADVATWTGRRLPPGAAADLGAVDWLAAFGDASGGDARTTVLLRIPR